jgi:hypothetical protein
MLRRWIFRKALLNLRLAVARAAKVILHPIIMIVAQMIPIAPADAVFLFGKENVWRCSMVEHCHDDGRTWRYIAGLISHPLSVNYISAMTNSMETIGMNQVKMIHK